MDDSNEDGDEYVQDSAVLDLCSSEDPSLAPVPACAPNSAKPAQWPFQAMPVLTLLSFL